MNHILVCQKCAKFTMNACCSCGGTAITTRPAKYSPQDKYANYRRKVKEAELHNQGLL